MKIYGIDSHKLLAYLHYKRLQKLVRRLNNPRLSQKARTSIEKSKNKILKDLEGRLVYFDNKGKIMPIIGFFGIIQEVERDLALWKEKNKG